MTQAELLAQMEATFDRCLQICEAKNSDYAGNDSADPFANFNASEVVQVPVVRGMLVRLMDKIVRVSNLLDQDNRVVDETIEDTLHDGINYIALIKCKLIEDGKVSETV